MFMKSQWNNCLYFFYLGCYLSIWHCYLSSILAFKIEFQISYNLWTKPLNQLRLIYEQLIYVLYLNLVVYISFVMNKFWLINWLIDWLPNNRDMLEKRLMRLNRWFRKDFKFYEDYNKFMEEIISKGCVREAKTNSTNGRTRYLPHHGVYHPHNPSKLRVVFDCCT